MSPMRIFLLGSYLAGIVALLLAVAIRMELLLLDSSARGALSFSMTCFLCTLATHEVASKLEKLK